MLPLQLSQHLFAIEMTVRWNSSSHAVEIELNKSEGREFMTSLRETNCPSRHVDQLKPIETCGHRVFTSNIRYRSFVENS